MSRLVRHEQAPKRCAHRYPSIETSGPRDAAASEAVAELFERRPARIGVSSSWVCGSRFRSLPQTGQRPAQSGACRIWSGSASAIASRAQAESSSWSSTTYSLRSSSARARLGGVVLAGVDVDVDDGVREAAHARPVQPHVEGEPEVEPGGRLRDRQGRLDLVRHGQVALAAELERLELDLDRVAVLVPGAEAQPAERVAGHVPAPS